MNDANPLLTDLFLILTFQGGFNTNLVLTATILLGMAAGSSGTFLVLRKRTMMSDALAHCTLPGLAFAFLFGILINIPEKNFLLLLFGATLSGFFGVLCVHGLVRFTRLSEDSAIGAVLSSFFGLGIVLLSAIQDVATASAGGLHHFIFGQTASMTQEDLILTGVVAVCALIATLALFKEFSFLCFDSESAAVQGWPVGRLDLLLLLLVTLVTIIGLQAVGIILIIALLSIPASSARFWSQSLSRVFMISIFFGALSGYCGAAISALLPGLPTGAVIVLVAGFFFFISFFFAPYQGFLAERFRTHSLRLRILREHILRASFEYIELHNQDKGSLIPFSILPGMNHRLSLTEGKVFSNLKREGLLVLEGTDHFKLTDTGYSAAAKFTRSHRLWEVYIAQQGSIPGSHVDYSADLVEHVLSPDIVERLEQRLSKEGRLPENVPESIHALDRRRS